MGHRREELALGAVGAGLAPGEVLGLFTQELIFQALGVEATSEGFGGKAGGDRTGDGPAHQGRDPEGGEGRGEADKQVLEPRRRIGALNQKQQRGEGGGDAGPGDPATGAGGREGQTHKHEIDQLPGFEMEGLVGDHIGQHQAVDDQGGHLQVPELGTQALQAPIGAKADRPGQRRQAVQHDQGQAVLVERVTAGDDHVVAAQRAHESADDRQIHFRKRFNLNLRLCSRCFGRIGFAHRVG